MKKIISILMILVILGTCTAVVAGALESPTKEQSWHITVKTDGDGSADADKYSIIKNEDETVTLTAKDGVDSFTEWQIDGSYTIVDGSLTSRVLTIKPSSDIVATAKFGGGSSSSKSSSGTNSSSTSPKTGSFTYALILTLLAVAAGAVAIVISRKVKQK